MSRYYYSSYHESLCASDSTNLPLLILALKLHNDITKYLPSPGELQGIPCLSGGPASLIVAPLSPATLKTCIGTSCATIIKASARMETINIDLSRDVLFPCSIQTPALVRFHDGAFFFIFLLLLNQGSIGPIPSSVSRKTALGRAGC